MALNKERLTTIALKWWPVVALLAIFLFAFYIRGINSVPDRMLSFDPIFQYRFTKYVVDWHTLPAWDELSYYVGRPIFVNQYPPFMWYATALIQWLIGGFGLSLMTVAVYAATFYGALITIPAFLLGRELSNKWGGLMAAMLMGTAPQILIRTFGASYDTDQLVIFFILMTLFLGVYALRRRTPASIFAAIAGFTAFMMAWGMFTYTLFMLIAFAVICFLLNMFLPEGGKLSEIGRRLKERALDAAKVLRDHAVVLVATLVATILIGTTTGANPIRSITSVIGFAQSAEQWIVNISIAELQPFSIFNLGGWMLAMGRFMIGIDAIDMSLFVIFIGLLLFGIWYGRKRGNFELAFILMLLAVSVYTTFRGIRFTEFTSAFFIIIIATGFGYVIEWAKKRDAVIANLALGLGILIFFIVAGMGLQIGQQLGPDISPNWDSAWDFLRLNTPEMSLVGTWWDPGHMITGLAERRVIGDGAHCTYSCLLNINDRITDLGKIMATTDENESVRLIQKYQGTSPKAYWIASEDLIGKFQWVQYFGTGCDARTESRCPLYSMVSLSQVGYGQNNSISVRHYSNIVVLASDPPIPVLVQNRNAAIFDEVIWYKDGTPTTLKISDTNMTALIEQLGPLKEYLNVRFVNQTVSQTIWIPEHQQYVVVIPPTLRETVFTKMFMLEGQGLDHFKQVFANSEVKIYEVVN